MQHELSLAMRDPPFERVEGLTPSLSVNQTKLLRQKTRRCQPRFAGPQVHASALCGLDDGESLLRGTDKSLCPSRIPLHPEDAT
jgi:hypothetical protein